jgi:long-chain acyl-CoA synthetase
VLDRLAALAKADPHGAAITPAGGRPLTFGRWDAESTELSEALAARSLEPGNRVGLWFESAAWADFAVAVLGVLKAGAVAVPTALGISAATRERMLDETGCVGVLTSGAEVSSGARWSSTVAGALASPDRAQPHPPRDGDPAVTLLNSGTTSGGTAVTACHTNIGAEIQDELPSGERPVFLHAFDPSFNTGFSMLIAALDARFEFVTMPRFDPDLFGSLAHERAAEAAMLDPFSARRLLRAETHLHNDLASIRHLTLTAGASDARLLADLQAALPGATIHNAYSSTEAHPGGTTMAYDPRRPTALGRAEPDVVRVIDERGRALPPGVDGWIELRTPGVPPRSAENCPVKPDGWIATRDIGRIGEDGYLYLLDRGADVVEVDGRTVSTLDVEAAVRRHLQVIDVAVYGAASSRELVVAVVGLEDVDEQAVRESAVEAAGGADLTIRIEQVDRIPRSPAGKPLKRVLRERRSTS